MPVVGFAPENKQKSPYEYPKISLETGGRARISAVEDKPTFEYVHALQAPVLIDGQPQYETVTKFGRTTEEMKTDFIGRHICIGDYAVLGENAVDPKGCPVCKASTESDAVRPPERRFAMHVIEYTLVPGTFTVAEPFSISLKAWVFANNRFDTLVDLGAEWGDLRSRDLNLGPCKSKQYQNYDIAVAQKAEWLANKDRQAMAKEIYQNQACKDLSMLIGRKISRELIEEDLDRVLSAYRIATGKGPAVEPMTHEEYAGEVADSAVDVSDILGGDAAPELSDATVKDEAPTTEGAGPFEMDLDDVLSGLS